MTINAKYEKGVLKPLSDPGIEDGMVVEVSIRAKFAAQGKRGSVKDLSFYGIWENRTDMADSVSYVNGLRDHPRA
jgi:predicted DNA-binding antitoxin AbrB/MazE fold protein